MKILVCGSRNWYDYDLILKTLKLYSAVDLIIEGGQGTVRLDGKAYGADKMAGRAARELGIELCVVPANWNALGKAAGPIRNRQMMDMKPDLVIAFHDDLTTSRGTADTVREAKRRGIPVEVITHATSRT